jgi:hypothetical protein
MKLGEKKNTTISLKNTFIVAVFDSSFNYFYLAFIELPIVKKIILKGLIITKRKKKNIVCLLKNVFKTTYKHISLK